MVFLFSLINISFTLFFFLFWQYVESTLFWLLTVVFVMYFSKILSFFIKEQTEKEDGDNRSKKVKNPEIFRMDIIVKYFRKWSYYVSFVFFYVSLYGFVYGINLIYDFSAFSDIFHYMTFFISFIVTVVFFLFLPKKHETIFLVFRSNCIVFTLIYSFFLVYLLVSDSHPSGFFVVNSTFCVAALFSVLVLDPFFKRKNRYLYPSFLFYLFLFCVFYTSLILPTVSLWYVILGMLVVFMALSTFIFPYTAYLGRFGDMSRYIGVHMGYINAFTIVSSVFLEPLSIYYAFIAGMVVWYHYIMHRFFKNPISYIIILLMTLFFYVKIFFLLWSESSFSYFVFIFLLPYMFVGISYLVSLKRLVEIYALHSLGIGFSIFSLLYYFIHTGSVDILTVSAVSFFESILFFISYLRFKK